MAATGLPIEAPTQALETETGIVIRPPTSKVPYWVLNYYDSNGRRRHRKVGRHWAGARQKIVAIDAMLRAGSLDRALRPLRELVDAWLADRETELAAGSVDFYRDRVDRHVMPLLGEVLCGELSTEMLQAAIDHAPTLQERDKIRRCISAMINWGYDEKWLQDRAPELLRGVKVRDPHAPVRSGSRRSNRGGTGGESEHWVDPETIPSHTQVAAIAAEWAREIKPESKHAGRWRKPPWWWELMFIFAAYTGIRQGELFYLRKKDIDLEGRHVHIRKQVVEVKNPKTGKEQQVVTDPKNGEARRTLIPADTPAGYDLLSALARRLKEIDDPEGTVFPAPRGGWWWKGNFDALHRAACRRLGMPERTLPSGHKRQVFDWHSARHVFCTWLINECGAGPEDVATAAGHADTHVLIQRYVSKASGALDRLAARAEQKQP